MTGLTSFGLRRHVLLASCIVALTFSARATLAADDVTQCARTTIVFDGIEPLRYATVTGEKGGHVTLYREHPALCDSRKNTTCTSNAYLVPGDVVAVANTCGEFAHVQFIGDKKVSYGWVETNRLRQREAK